MRAKSELPELQPQKKFESKLLDRAYVEFPIEAKAGRVTRKEAVELLAKELGVPSETVGLIRLEGHSGTTNLLGKFYVYGSQESKKRAHPKHLEIRLLPKEERQKLKEAKKKIALAAPGAEAKK